MALFDVDKNGTDRGNPNPNTHDVLMKDSVLAKGTNSVNYISAASSQSSLTSGKNGQFTIVQVGTFTTSQAYTTTIGSASTFTQQFFNVYQAAHNLAFTPTILAYELSGSGQYSQVPYGNFVASSGVAIWYNWLMFVDSTNVYIQLNIMQWNDGTHNFNFNAGFAFKWYLLYQTMN